ncbi:AraC family transcriptional regulator [Mameliella alba]|uniref:Transcriptional regulator, AraC family n=1 Tax=Mameliella alba TaxID=561184 RepID=A0A0B3S000_9RHOB|nr:AraC family transcriptional regulator [Mameliella alba]KHQ49836.1 Transcriptional regulator, AraC family [Mameliella alba]
MSDPLADVVSLLKPVPSISKLVSGGGRWIVERSNMGSPFYCAMVEGSCWMTISGRAPIRLTEGDFVLVPAIFDFSMSSLDPPAGVARPNPLEVSPGVFRLGDPDTPAEVQALVGHCAFASKDKELLVSLLPEVIHVHGADRLTALVKMINDETRSNRAARDMVLGRLLDVLLIEALRSTAETSATPGLLRGLTDPQLGDALTQIHAHPDHPHSVVALAKTAAMSRSTFYDRFRREIGAAPMEYVTSWRMALAKDMLMRRDAPIADIARRVGYGSASAFSVAFARHVGTPPGAFAAIPG